MNGKYFLWLGLFLSGTTFLYGQSRIHTSLNGIWQFEQTQNAFPPLTYSRTCPVPGLIHLASPRIADYDVFFQKPDHVESVDYDNLLELDYVPKYSWYRKEIELNESYEGMEVTLTLLKSQYETRVFVNGMDMGGSISCYTPIVLPITRAIRLGEPNEILIRVGDRAWLPSQAAGGTDKEKAHYLPGIWDDVFLTFSGKIFLQDVLPLPSVKDRKVSLKLRLRNYNPAQVYYGDPMYDTCQVHVTLREFEGGKVIKTSGFKSVVKRDNQTMFRYDLPLESFTVWTPEKPFLYTVEVSVSYNATVSDQLKRNFGMRDFEIKDRYFFLNGEKYLLRGTNITLHRFFEDPDCGDLPWNREWVKKMLIDKPRELNWNAMRICVGIVPSFWYDLADEYGMMFQNEWLYWQNHGWDDQVRQEYTDWVWSDGSHPSIVIWDAINENWDSYIGNFLIPELKLLDPTRIWDAGYMTGREMIMDEMDEPHPYRAGWNLFIEKDIGEYLKNNPYPLGKLDYWPEDLEPMLSSTVPQLVNEYGWIWLWRDGRPAKLTVRAYNYILGQEATPASRRELQAYWTQLETEWLRSQTSFAGILSFCYLANNYGFTGDWFINDIKDLEPGPTLKWFRHGFSPVAVFINMADERYLPVVSPHKQGERLQFSLWGINDLSGEVSGPVLVNLIDSDGNKVAEKKYDISIPAYGKMEIQADLQLPGKAGGYLVTAYFGMEKEDTVISRRYIRVGKLNSYTFFDLQP